VPQIQPNSQPTPSSVNQMVKVSSNFNQNARMCGGQPPPNNWPNWSITTTTVK
jgi:hypothetical protein